MGILDDLLGHPPLRRMSAFGGKADMRRTGPYVG